MSNKIIVFCGSPRRNGNTNRIVKWFVDGATDAGAEVEVVDAARLHFKTKGCIACFRCQESPRFECQVEDEVAPIIARVPEADVVVMATPVYWFSPTAQLKLVLDRMFSLIKMNPETDSYDHQMNGKILAVIATAGGDYESGLNCVDLTFTTAARFLGMTYKTFFLPESPGNPADLEQNVELQEQAQAFGRLLGS